MFTRYLFCGVILSAVILFPAPPQAMGQTAIFSDDLTHPNSLVPFQLDGVRFNPGTYYGAFTRPYFSPDGSKWILACTNNGASSADSMLIRGSGFSATRVLREGKPTPFAVGENYGPFARQTDINDNGDFVFRTDTDGYYATDVYVIKWDNNAGSYEIVAQEGSPAAGYPGLIYDSSTSMHQILADGRISYLGDLDTSSSEDRVFYFVDGGTATPRAREGHTIPTGAADPYRTITETVASVDHSGNNWLLNAEITDSATGDRYDVITINNSIVMQENGNLPGLARPLGEDGGFTFDWAEISGNGDWLARGAASYQTPGAEEVQKWVALNGSLIAAGGEPIFAGSSETWDFDESVTFDFSVHNDLGDVAIGGQLTSGEKVIVYLGSLGEFVLMREGDPIDFDGNGQFDDGTFLGGPFTANGGDFSTFGADRAALSNNGTLLFVGSVDDATGSTVAGRTLISVPLPAPGLLLGDMNCDGTLDVNDVAPFALALTDPTGYAAAFPGCEIARGDMNQDGGANALDIADFVAALLAP